MKSSNLLATTILILTTITCVTFSIVMAKQMTSTNNYQEKLLTLWTNQKPTTADPYEFDLLANHIAYGAVQVKLFTSYKDSKISGSLAKTWGSKNSARTWTIKIRQDLNFANGDKITAYDVALSIKRILWLAKKNNSNLPLRKKIQDISALKRIEDDFLGIKVIASDELEFNFNEPEENLPEILSFGLYGIAHKECFDLDSGKWRENNNCHTSGPYIVSNKNENGISLEKRKDYPLDLSAEHSPFKIHITHEPSLKEDAQIIEGAKESFTSEAHHFKGNSSADVIFMHVLSEKKFLKKMGLLKKIRWLFYQKMSESSLTPVKSFFPLIHPNLEEIFIADEKILGTELKGIKINFKPPRDKQSPFFKSITAAFMNTITELGGEINLLEDISTDTLRKIARGVQQNEVDLDFATRITAIGNEDPRETLRFMLSLEGIYLPDPSGQLNKLVQTENFALQDANKIIFQDAIVWPIYHYSNGFWAHESLDLSRYNHQWPLSELQWIGWK